MINNQKVASTILVMTALSAIAAPLTSKQTVHTVCSVQQAAVIPSLPYTANFLAHHSVHTQSSLVSAYSVANKKTVQEDQAASENTAESTAATETTEANEVTEAPTVYDEQYPVADKIYRSLIEAGYSKAVAAGILGNCMIEAGGATLNIQPEIYSSDKAFYGICQWSAYYCASVQGATLDLQLEYLLSTIEAEFKTFGAAFGCTYERFCDISDPAEAAKRFAQIYERCAASSYTIRQQCAVKAYNYFNQEE